MKIQDSPSFNELFLKTFKDTWFYNSEFKIYFRIFDFDFDGIYMHLVEKDRNNELLMPNDLTEYSQILELLDSSRQISNKKTIDKLEAYLAKRVLLTGR